MRDEAYKHLVDALSQGGFVEDSSLQATIDEAKTLAKTTKPISQSDVVDYSFLRAAVKKLQSSRPATQNPKPGTRNYFIASCAREKSKTRSNGTVSLIRSASLAVSMISRAASAFRMPVKEIT